MAIQLLRGTTAQIGSNNSRSIAGQPLYDMDKHILYIGDGQTAINELEGTTIGLNVENGESQFSLQQSGITDAKKPRATGLGAIAFGGFRGDKPDNQPDEEDTTTTASGIQAFATGAGTHAKGNWSATFGKDTKAFGRQSIAGGGGTQAGRETDADNTFIAAFAMGELCKALARASTALGNSTTAEGLHSLAVGYGTHTIGANSFASGEHTETGGQGSATFGSHTGTGNNYAAAFGEYAWAKALGSLAAGLATIASTPYGAVFGKHNKENQDALLIIGNGNGIENRNNAFEVLSDGRAKVYTAPEEYNDVLRWQEKEAIETKIDTFIESIFKVEDRRVCFTESDTYGTGLWFVVPGIYRVKAKYTYGTESGTDVLVFVVTEANTSDGYKYEIKVLQNGDRVIATNIRQGKGTEVSDQMQWIYLYENSGKVTTVSEWKYEKLDFNTLGIV